MYPELAVDNDAGTRAVSPRVQATVLETGAYSIFILSTVADGGFWLGSGDGSVRYLRPGRSALNVVKKVGLDATPLCGVAGIDEEYLLVGTDDGRVIRVPRKGRHKFIYQGDRWIEHLVRAPKRGIYACVCGRKVVLLDEEGAVIQEIRDHPSTPAGLAFSPSGKELAVVHYNGVSVWQVSNGRRARKLDWHGSHTGIAWSPDGRYIVTTTQEKELHGWRMPSGTDVRMSGYPTKIRSIEWTPDARYLVASGADTVTSWNFEGEGPSGKPPMEFGYVFNGVVTQVSAHPTKCIVAAGYNNGTVLIGSIEYSNAWIARPPGSGAVTALSWHPGGESVVAGTENGELTYMQLEPGFCEEMFA